MERVDYKKTLLLLIICSLAGLFITTAYLYRFANKSATFCLIVIVLSTILIATCSIILLDSKLKGKRKYIRMTVRIISVFGLTMGILLVADFYLPTSKSIEVEVIKKYITDNECIVQFGKYNIAVKQTVFDTIAEHDTVLLEFTPLFLEIKSITFIKGLSGRIAPVTPNEFYTKLLGLILIALPLLGVFCGERKHHIYLVLLFANFIFGLIALGLWIKLLVNKL